MPTRIRERAGGRGLPLRARPLPLCLIVMFPLYMTLSSNSPVSLEKPAGSPNIGHIISLVKLLAKRRVD